MAQRQTKLRKVPITMRALIQRINRKLADDDDVLKVARGEKMRQDAGDFYIVNTRLNGLTGKDVDPEKLARELGLLKDWEAVSE